MKPALKAAIDAITRELMQADGAALKGGPPESVSVKAEPETCAACEAGTCMDPEHMSDDDMSAMLEG